MRGRTLRTGLLLVVATLLTATGCLSCMQGEAPCPAEQPPLKNTSWVLEAYGEPGNLTPALASTDVTLEFGDDVLSGSAGCNDYGGACTIDGGSLEVSDLANTEMYCMEPGVMEQEEEYLTTLREARSYEVVEGKLRITGAGKVLSFTRE